MSPYCSQPVFLAKISDAASETFGRHTYGSSFHELAIKVVPVDSTLNILHYIISPPTFPGSVPLEPLSVEYKFYDFLISINHSTWFICRVCFSCFFFFSNFILKNNHYNIF